MWSRSADLVRGKAILPTHWGTRSSSKGPVLFTPTGALVQRLLAAKRDLRLPQELAKLDRFECLILDDIGYVQHDRDEMEVLFTLLAERYERKSIVITTNLVFSEWERIFKDALRRLLSAGPTPIPKCHGGQCKKPSRHFFFFLHAQRKIVATTIRWKQPSIFCTMIWLSIVHLLRLCRVLMMEADPAERRGDCLGTVLPFGPSRRRTDRWTA